MRSFGKKSSVAFSPKHVNQPRDDDATRKSLQMRTAIFVNVFAQRFIGEQALDPVCECGRGLVRREEPRVADCGWQPAVRKCHDIAAAGNAFEGCEPEWLVPIRWDGRDLVAAQKLGDSVRLTVGYEGHRFTKTRAGDSVPKFGFIRSGT